MHKKFEINLTKIKGGCQLGRKVVTHNSNSDLPLKDGFNVFELHKCIFFLLYNLLRKAKGGWLNNSTTFWIILLSKAAGWVHNCQNPLTWLWNVPNISWAFWDASCQNTAWIYIRFLRSTVRSCSILLRLIRLHIFRVWKKQSEINIKSNLARHAIGMMDIFHNCVWKMCRINWIKGTKK